MSIHGKGSLGQLIQAKRCRTGGAAGTTKHGAFWLVCPAIRIRNFGGNGLGHNSADGTFFLHLRHYRNGDVVLLLQRHTWHQNYGSEDTFFQCPALADCASVEEVIVGLKAGCPRRPGCDCECCYSDSREPDVTAALTALGLPVSAPAPDDKGDPLARDAIGKDLSALEHACHEAQAAIRAVGWELVKGTPLEVADKAISEALVPF